MLDGEGNYYTGIKNLISEKQLIIIKRILIERNTIIKNIERIDSQSAWEIINNHKHEYYAHQYNNYLEEPEISSRYEILKNHPNVTLITI